MKTVLITGANRGIGFEFVKQLYNQGYHIIATCRSPEKADTLMGYAKDKPQIVIKPLDTTNDNDIAAIVDYAIQHPIDWLINNAGITGTQGVTIGNIERKNFLDVFNVNCLSPLKLSEALLPAFKQHSDRLIVCMSSRMSSISDNNRGRSYAYRTSKAALNCAMRSFALDVQAMNIQVMLLHPGWVKTAIGGSNAPLQPKESVKQMLNLIEKHKNTSHAEALWSYDGTPIGW